MAKEEIIKLYEQRKAELVKTIEIVRNNLDKIQTDQRDRVIAAVEGLEQLASKELKIELPEEKAPEEVKPIKEHIENLLRLFKDQLDAVKAVEKLLKIETDLDKVIDVHMSNLVNSVEKEQALKFLDGLQKDIKLEANIVNSKEYAQLRRLVADQQKIRASYTELRELGNVLVAKAEQKHPSNPLYNLAMQIHTLLDQMEHIIKADEEGKLNILMRATNQLIGPEGVETKMLATIAEVRKKVEEAFTPDNVKMQAALLQSGFKTLNEIMAATVTDLQKLEEAIKELIQYLEQILEILTEAKKQTEPKFGPIQWMRSKFGKVTEQPAFGKVTKQPAQQV